MVLRSQGPDHSSQLLKGVLDMCLLAVISEQPTYGYEMARKLQARGLDLVSDGSIYPSLSRLQKQGLVEGYLVEAGSGPARKYYRLAASGRKALQAWTAEWRNLASGVDGLLNGGSDV